MRIFAQQKLSAEGLEANARRHAQWCTEQLGEFPDDQLENLEQAEWCLQHYADLQAAERFYDERGELDQALFICTGTALMIQLDDGAREREKLQRAQEYLAREPSVYWQARLHATAALCAVANRSTQLMVEHSDCLPGAGPNNCRIPS